MYVQGVSTRKVQAITELCGHEFSALAISEINKKLDEQLDESAQRKLEEELNSGCACLGRGRRICDFRQSEALARGRFRRVLVGVCHDDFLARSKSPHACLVRNNEFRVRDFVV